MDKITQLKDLLGGIGIDEKNSTIHFMINGHPVRSHKVHGDIIDLFFKIGEILK